jgi:hypothetical protein
MTALSLNHLFMIPNQQNNMLLFLYYIFTWILCHQMLPSFHEIMTTAAPGTQTIQCVSDHFSNMHFALLPTDYKVQINPPSIHNWNNKELFYYLKKLIKKLQENSPNIAKVLQLFVKKEFSMIKKSQRHFRKLKELFPDASIHLPWFEGFYIMEKHFDQTKYERFCQTLKPLTQQIDKNQNLLSNIIYTSIRTHMEELQHAIHHEDAMTNVVFKIKQKIHFDLDNTFQFVQTKEVDFREMILHFYDFYLDLEEIENKTFSFVVKLQVLFSMLVRETHSFEKKVIVETNGTPVETIDFSEMCKVHPILRSSMMSDFCKLNYSLVQ